MTRPGARVVVVSPHLDDAVLSLGAFISRTVCAGSAVDVVTVFAGDPHTAAPAGKWDARSGFLSAGEASRGRRQEDGAACRLLGATPVWLPFLDEQYGSERDRETVVSAIDVALGDADIVLLPGFPLAHRDHAWVAEAVLRRLSHDARTGLYVEWPYAHSRCVAGSSPKVPELLTPFASGAEFGRLPTRYRDLVRKWRAVRCYRSQTPLLGRLIGRSRPGAARLVWAEERAWGEGIAWLDRTGAAAR